MKILYGLKINGFISNFTKLKHAKAIKKER
jgi:hypothetical protein